MAKGYAKLYSSFVRPEGLKNLKEESDREREERTFSIRQGE
jgi:hypothetical protein